MPDFTPVGSLLAGLLGAAPSPPPAPLLEDALSTGLPALDALTGGWRPGELVLVGGEAGAGKSALLYGQALHTARSGGRVALAPLKHTASIALWRLTSTLAGVELQRMMRGELSLPERAAVAAAAEELSGLPLHVMTAEATGEELVEQARRLHRAHGLALLVVDGVHALDAGGERDEGAVPRPLRLAQAMAGLRDVAHELRVPVLTSVSPAADAERLAPSADRTLRIDATDAQGIATLELRMEGAVRGSARLRFAAARLRFEPAQEPGADLSRGPGGGEG